MRVRSMACEGPLKSKCSLYLTLIGLLLPNVLSTSSRPPTTLSGCPDKCGNISIPYPFGMGRSCFRDGFEVTCNVSATPPRALLGSKPKRNIELKDINITSGEAHISTSTLSYLCFNQSDQIYGRHQAYLNLTDLPFLFSEERNKFTLIGCYNLAVIVAGSTVAGCLSYCENLNNTISDGSPCNGSGCCQAPIPSAFNSYVVYWSTSDNNSAWQFNPCMYALLAKEDWYKFQTTDLIGNNFLERNKKDAPVVLDWAIRDNGTCRNGVEKSSNPACLSKNSICYNTTNGDGYLCNCTNGYWGNPYLPDGCIDIDECQFPDKYPCYGRCANIEGNYECHCPKGRMGNAKISNCTKHENFPVPAQITLLIILGVAILLGLCFMLATHLQNKKHKKEKEEYQRYYNMMDNYLRVFSKKQIEIATNNFDENRVLGTGGHGNVYKGYLEDNKPVAIKRSKEVVEEDQRAEFVNEILLLSQINHKNIVRLIGCCMEVKIPMLIYEFISNGTLYDLLHGKGRNSPISLNARLTIALESAEALDYLHSTISRAILHGDVKSANILLDENYHVKVSDFGASNLVPIDDTQVVKVVQGTRGYLDPEYVATAVLTKKSDVYSFGVILLELITRKCAIFTDESLERKHLASCFVSNVNKKRLHDLLDEDIVSTDEEITGVLQEVSELAVWCLCIRGDDRPTMRQVVEKLQSLVKFNSSLLGSRTIPEETEKLISESTYHVIPDTSALHSTSYSSVLEIETGMPR